VRGKRGRGASGKTPVIGLLKRNGKVFVQVVNDCSRKELLRIIKGQGHIFNGQTIYEHSPTLNRNSNSIILNLY